MRGEGVDGVGSALRPLLVQASDFRSTSVVAVSDLFREVVPVLVQAVTGVEVGVLGAVSPAVIECLSNRFRFPSATLPDDTVGETSVEGVVRRQTVLVRGIDTCLIGTDEGDIGSGRGYCQCRSKLERVERA